MNAGHIAPSATALCALLLISAPCTARTGDPAAGARVVVRFDHPEKYDINMRLDDAPFEDRDRSFVLSSIERYVADRAPIYLPEGYHFYVRFTDIVLAGRFRFGQVAGPRLITSATPPEFAFAWIVTDGSGKIVKEGYEQLIDMDFKFEDASTKTAEFSIEKAVLDGWMRVNLRIQPAGPPGGPGAGPAEPSAKAST